MAVRMITPPSAEPISIDELRADLRISHNDDDAILARHLAWAREFVERRLQIKLMPQTWELVIDYFPTAEVRLPFGPVLSIAQVAYDDAESGLEVVLDSAEYYLDSVSDPPWLFPVTAWPTTLDAVNAARIRFVAGFADADAVPGAVKAAIRLKVQDLYDGTDNARAVDDLLTNHYQMVA